MGEAGWDPKEEDPARYLVCLLYGRQGHAPRLCQTGDVQSKLLFRVSTPEVKCRMD